ncbi:hypothetical protein M6I34_17205 [Burkholderiaceae bacterium FT117]|uniref:hypothetical protein n=1 Tax=Zeimonas sediminis TaxID=2944268 RepID=UPI002342FE95|nr:hypothetical protein [Zeimonas sediminis]MCM5572257.1 hypothetical protein [Zeimonas sediminis]
MNRNEAPLDASEPPGGDFVRYVEQLNARTAEQAAGPAQPSATARPSTTERPSTTAGPPATARPAGAARASAPTRPAPTTRAGEYARPPARHWPAGPARALALAAGAWWLIGAGIALVLMSVLDGGPAVDTMLPGLLVLGTGLVLRKRTTKKPTK